MFPRARLLFIAPLLLSVLLLLFSGISSVAYASQQNLGVTNLQVSSTRLTAQIQVSEWQINEQNGVEFLSIPGAISDSGTVPIFTTWLAAVDGNRPVATVQAYGSLIPTGVYDQSAPATSPGCSTGDPVLFKGIPLFPIRITPATINESGELYLPEQLDLSVEFVPDQQITAMTNTSAIRMSEDMYQMMDDIILNLDELDITVTAPLGRILVVTPDDDMTIEQLQDYVQWKRELGYQVEVMSPESNGNHNDINDLITSRFMDDSVAPLEHILLIGDDGNGVSDACEMACGGNYGDHVYTLLSGADEIPDVSIGRFSVRDLTTLGRVVNKTIAYERDVYMDDPEWLSNAVITAGAGSGYSIISTCQTVNWNFLTHGFETDTLWYTMGGSIPDYIIQHVNEGASFVNFRGYYGMSGWNNNHCALFANESKLPVFVTITCGTGSWSTEVTAKSEGIFRAGSGVSDLQGAVACIGTATTNTHTRFNNIVDTGFFDAALFQNVRSVGWALVCAKMRLYETYFGTSDFTQSLDFADWNNLMGDPALRMWMGQPVVPTVECQPNVPQGQNYLDVDVSCNGTLPEFAWATLTQDEVKIDSRRLDSNGHVRLFIDSENDNGENFTLVVAGDNMAPFRGTIFHGEASAQIGIESVDIVGNDSHENFSTPNETLEVTLHFHNYGYTGADGSGTVTSDSPWLEIESGDDFTLPHLNPQESYTLATPVVVHVDPSCPDGAVPSLNVSINNDMLSAIQIPITAWTTTSGGEVSFSGTPGVLLPGNTASLFIPISNVGHIPTGSLQATLSTTAPGITINDSQANYPSIVSNDTISNLGSAFLITASEQFAMGQRISLTLTVESEFGAIDSVHTSFYIGDPREFDVTGPDEYGYWALDSEDDSTLFSLVPRYSWYNINGIGDHLNINDTSDEDDGSVVVNLPFTFRYYGQNYHRITVCSNGWIAMGEHANMVDFRNYTIPSPSGPPAMIAPFWDDLRTSGAGNGIWSYYDPEMGYYIIQWNVQTAFNSSQEDFQVILMDPSFYPTTSGNGRILFVYDVFNLSSNVGSDNRYVTIGIENQDQSDGVLYTYWTDYTAGSTPLEDQMAILFTDDLATLPSPPLVELFPTDGFDFVITGSETLRDSFFIGNLDGGVLTWNLTMVDDNVPMEARLSQAQRYSQYSSPGKSVEDSSTVGKPGSHYRKGMDDQSLTPLDQYYLSVEKGEQGLGGPPELDNFGGPDAFGYIWKDSNEPGGPEYAWHSNLGRVINSFAPDYDDGFSDAIELPFSFPFYGVEYNEIYINTNGYISFIPDQEPLWSNRILPDETANLAMIGPWWDDLNLDPDDEGGGEVYFWHNDENLAVVTWSECIGWGGRGGPYTFQLLLKSNGLIKFQYQDMGEEDDDRHDESTIGIQNADATIGLTVIHEWAGYIENELAVSMLVPQYWFSVSPHAGYTISGEIDAARISILGEDLPFGDYQGSILFQSNSSNLPNQLIPVSLSVLESGHGPYISQIPSQTVALNEDFDLVNLNDYVVDPNYPDNQIEWDVAGENHLIIQINNGIAVITAATQDWTGSDDITFIASNPENLSDSCVVTFTKVAVNQPPVAFMLRRPENEMIFNKDIINFIWDPADDPEGMPVTYTLYIQTLDDTVSYSTGQLFAATVMLDSTGLPDNGTTSQDYHWWVEASDPRDHVTMCDEAYAFIVDWTYIEEADKLPEDFAISDPWPNPFNSTVAIEVALPQMADASIEIYDVLGRRVEKIVRNSLSPGYHTLTWNGQNVASGVYFIRSSLGPQSCIRKVTLLR